MAKINDDNIHNYDEILEELKKFRGYLVKTKGKELKGCTKIENVIYRHMHLIDIWKRKYVQDDDSKWFSVGDMDALTDSLDDYS